MKTFNLDKSFSKLINLTDTLEIKKNSLTENGLPKFGGNCYYTITIPIFSLDHNMAYVQQSMLCNFLGGGASGIYLSKINGKWKIVRRVGLWIS
ncbi:hypothetical protein [Mucilaginibacter psychrotolerans]|uniref:Uncharacterized protein n=1 Tax=Mucilaginibacter psychrotolerans TaxID=1524096 RepID=A0A4Y8S5Z2_9SPHI|nr:hypothetical protein [Mucilaginibacter psychrotolerans]TFF33887.1 hypothetical protein E2R66_23710 [Mucilaginibacter psychrotolerans]